MTISKFRVAGSVAVAIALAATRSVAQGVPDDFVIRLERTACFGECPVYSVSIDARGIVTYEGTRFVRVAGRQTDRIQTSRVAALLATAERIGFFEFRDGYRVVRRPDGSEMFVFDLPTTFVTITRDGQSKRVEDYVGAPPELEELEQQIDATARTNRWIRIDRSTLRQLIQSGASPSAEERAALLRKALEYDEVDAVKALLEIGADPNAAYFATNTPPLMMIRSAATAQALIDAGAIPLTTNDSGGTPLGSAVGMAPDVAKVLLNAGVPADQPTDSEGRTALWHAACVGNVGVVRLLIGAGSDPAGRPGGMSAAECASRTRQGARLLSLSVLDGKLPYVQDFDGVIAALEEAVAKRPER